MAFVGPHHGPKILGKNHQSTTKVTLNEPPITTICHLNAVFTLIDNLRVSLPKIYIFVLQEFHNSSLRMVYFSSTHHQK